ncbi:hypothetical protein [Streptomyces sp. IBSBF 2435]|uniref:hypothetical protein n=1 Tax=Streptomyces sp. IBSBF 2435 TaxID=2903531 RepID=UPI002FDC4C2E
MPLLHDTRCSLAAADVLAATGPGAGSAQGALRDRAVLDHPNRHATVEWAARRIGGDRTSALRRPGEAVLTAGRPSFGPVHLSAGSAAVTVAFTAGWTDSLPDLHLLRLVLADAEGRELSGSTCRRYRTPAAMTALSTASRVRTSATIGRVIADGPRRALTATVRNRGSAVAAMVRLSLLDQCTGERVLPTLYGDKHLWLLPGESRTVALSWPAHALPSGRPELRVKGCSSPAVTVR